MSNAVMRDGYHLANVRTREADDMIIMVHVIKVSDGTAQSRTVYIEVKSTRYSDRRLFQLSLWFV